MSVRPIVIAGESILHRPSALVESFDADVAPLAQDMIDTMQEAPGVGLAAPQIGVDAAVFVWNYSGYSSFDSLYGPALGLGEPCPSSGVVVNPCLELFWDEGRVLPAEIELERESEGCLSLPGYSFPLRRATRAILKGWTPEGEPVLIEAIGWLARIFQHEFDHLQGIVYIERLSEPWASQARAVAEAKGWRIPGIVRPEAQ